MPDATCISARAGCGGAALGRPGRGALGGRQAGARERAIAIQSARPRPPVGEGLPRGDRGVSGALALRRALNRGERGRGDRPQRPRRGRAACGRLRGRGARLPRSAADRAEGQLPGRGRQRTPATWPGWRSTGSNGPRRSGWPARRWRWPRSSAGRSWWDRTAIASPRPCSARAGPPRRCPSPAAQWRSWRSCATGIWTRRGRFWRNARRRWVGVGEAGVWITRVLDRECLKTHEGPRSTKTTKVTKHEEHEGPRRGERLRVLRASWSS